MPTRVSFREALGVWAKIGLLSFGGPAGQIALMHAELVEKRRWISEARFLHALNYCMLLPGPEATQLATYVGWLLHRTRGGIAAGTLFVLPGFVTMLALSTLYATLHHVPAIAALFFGLKAAVVAIVVEALLRIGKRALKTRALVAIAALAFAGIFVLAIPFPVIVLGAAILGALAGRFAPALLPAARVDDREDDANTVVGAMLDAGELAHARPSSRRAVGVLACGLALWSVPFVSALALGRDGSDHVFFAEAAFFSKAALVTFGGAYAVLAYVAQRAVEFGWLLPGEMLDGLGLAETTPGPLIMVVQFVGFLGAYRHGGPLLPLAAGVLGSIVTVWVTFVPCFLWIFLGAPFIESLRKNRALASALSAITAAVVGVILNLSVWFALHALFAHVGERRVGPAHLFVPEWRTLDPAALVLTVLSALAMFVFRAGLGKTLALAAAAGLVLSLVGLR